MPALLEEVKKRAARGERVLVTTLTKRLAEDLSRYLKEQGLRCKWLHSELDAFERVTILRELREGAFDALVGVNLLREGLDLPEVSMVCILDADKEGFLRSETSLIQTIGRVGPARQRRGRPLRRQGDPLDAAGDRRDPAPPRRCSSPTTPSTASPPRRSSRRSAAGSRRRSRPRPRSARRVGRDEATDATEEYLNELEAEMLKAAENLEFERAAALRDRILQLRVAGGRRPGSTGRQPTRARAPAARAKAKARAGRRRN